MRLIETVIAFMEDLRCTHDALVALLCDIITNGYSASSFKEVVMAFEVFDKRKSALGNAPRATLQKKGILSLNASAHRLLDDVESVEILYDPEKRIVALKPSTESYAYAFREVNPETGQVLLSLTAFTRYYKIPTDRRYIITPHMEEGMLMLPLPEAITVEKPHSPSKNE
jgi:hypothetical protein